MRDTNCRPTRAIMSSLNAVTLRPLDPTPIAQSVFVRFYRHSGLDLDTVRM